MRIPQEAYLLTPMCLARSHPVIAHTLLAAVVSRAGARTWLQLTGHGDMQGFDFPSAANGLFANSDTRNRAHPDLSQGPADL